MADEQPATGQGDRPEPGDAGTKRFAEMDLDELRAEAGRRGLDLEGMDEDEIRSALTGSDASGEEAGT